MKRQYVPTTKELVSSLLGWGFNCTEIAAHLDLHPVTVRRIKVELKKEFPYYLKESLKK